MEIRNSVSYVNIYGSEYKTQQTQNSEFRQLVDKLTGGKMAQEIREKYDVTLNIGSVGDVGTLFNRYDIRCKNYVCISQQTLRRMENDSALKNKVLHAIEEFSSPKEQAKVNALYPPVKSAGMIVYPDGEILYWLEGYPDEYEATDNKRKVVYDESISKLQNEYLSQEKDMMEEHIIFHEDETFRYQRKLQKKREKRELKERREQKERMEEALEEYAQYRRELRHYYNELGYQKKLAGSNPTAVPVGSVKRPPVVSAAYELIMMLGM